MPDTMAPMIQPMRAEEEVKPWRKSVYSKSDALMKNASNPFSAPEITAVS